MLSGMFQSTTIPVLQEVVNFAQSRQTVLAGNIANMDTPGYQVRDLSVEEFQARLRAAVEERHVPPAAVSPGELLADPNAGLAEISKNPKSILCHDKSNVGAEYQVSEMVKNQMQHNLALALMTQQFRLLQTAVSERL
jgi:flagellar basal-body rod protein FlgB